MDKRINGEIAVFISGPIRYVTLVNERLETVLKDCQYDCFFHLWKADLGNKVHRLWQSDYRELYEHPRAKVVVMQSPYSQEDFKDTIGIETASGSTINATMGMFFSVNLLCHYLKQLPDFEQYRYILRLRTDCAIINDNFVSLLDFRPDVLTVNVHTHIRKNWISDHICFGSVEQFFKLWLYEGMQEIYDAYEAGERFPELTLVHRYRSRLKGVKLNPSIKLFRDYHSVCFPPRGHEPKCIIDALNNAGLKNFFKNPSKYIDFGEVDKLNNHWKLVWEQTDAREQTDKLLEESKAGADELLKRGDAFLSSGHIPTAASIFAEAYRLWPKSAVRHWKSINPVHLDQIKRSAVELLTQQPEHEGAKVILDHIDRQTRAQEFFITGVNELRSGNDPAAMNCFNQISSDCMRIPDLHSARAMALIKLGDLQAAMEECRQELKKEPEHKGAKMLLERLENKVNELAVG